MLLEAAHGNIDEVTGEMIGRAFAAGDLAAKQVLQETVDLLSLWLSNIVDLLEPDVLIIGGGVADMLGPLFADIVDGLVKYCINSRCREIPLLRAHYGEDAGIAGAAALCLRS
jgi:predicted NBD/HSP70 family sugar kinase